MPERILGIRARVHELMKGIEVPPRTTQGLKDLFFSLAHRAYPEEHPPSHVFHVAQMDTLVTQALRFEDATTQEGGKRLVWAHDIGRAVDQGVHHTTAGAKILRDYGFDESMISFALAHHHWGLGVRGLSKENFTSRVSFALTNGGVREMFEELVEKQGIEALVALLADNSKRRISGDSFETEIYPYSADHARQLIEHQIADGKYERGSPTHEKEIVGSQFLYALIPHIEHRLGIRYAPDGSGQDIITRARSWWPVAKESVIAKWKTMQ
ncbi:MAG: hypothetical protein UY48_C0016G0006 [Candidatus Gottesmanbacteria bacterium GW2011_GWB1_49_7]|uniref:HD domain-containing protein n=1 Tax=Candidatus Gottesmanbacteria bacterium GW2011_GWB1_49_7 TaxID=1618448 RepID=A0A0G1YYV7_9BACT|nr:MAG: hypothetical protein UY48_C0016G0006 [Candidatus Gottesmanbacteria bacterium GW2011_GWB1_49_7]